LIGFFGILSKLSFRQKAIMSRRSPFIEFCYANRDAVKAENPTAEFGEIGKLLSARWIEQKNAEKAVYSEPRNTVRFQVAEQEPELRRSSRLRNKRLGRDFSGRKL
jgi:hypothetical protein